MAYFQAKMKSNGDKASPCFRPFWIRNVSQKYLLTWVSVWTYCHDLGVIIDGVAIGELDLLTTSIHHSEIQVITALWLISTLYKSPQHQLSLFSSLLCLHQPFPGNGFWQWRFFSFTRSGPFFSTTFADLNSQLTTNWVAQIVFKITPLHGQSRKHGFQQ
jgi:hypothetical protein